MKPTLIKPERLRVGDTIGLVNPSGAVHEADPYDDTREALAAMGLRVKEAPHLRARHGHMAGTAAERAADLHAMFSDPAVAGILAVTGGSGAHRVLPLLDWALIARHPKWLGGFSDLTALITAVHVKTGLVSFHSPLGRSDWNPFSVRQFRAVAMDAEAPVLGPPDPAVDGRAPDDGRLRALVGGRAHGPLQGGNLAVLTALAGTPYFPDCRGAILFLEDVNEAIYRVDRMLGTLALGGHLSALAGVVLGGFTNCKPSEGSYGTLTLDEVFSEHFGPLGVPVLRGAAFGHVRRKWTLPLGVPAELDADAGTLRLLEPAVR